ncbi:MAG: DUF4118 domain-containing protein [Azospirillum sp.]|nr:DUF4118 domain-containing protein [Azospirillum sp.]
MRTASNSRFSRPPGRTVDLLPAGLLVVIVIAASMDAAALILSHGSVSKVAVTMLLLLAVVWIAIRFGRLCSTLTALAGVGTINYFFQEPFYSFGLVKTEDIVTLMVFMATAAITGGLAARAREEASRHREQAEIARQRTDEVSTLYVVGERIAAVQNVAELTALIEREIPPLLGIDAPLALIPTKDIDRLASADGLAAGETLRSGQVNRGGIGNGRLFIPVRTTDSTFGVLAAGPDLSAATLDARQSRLLTAVGHQVGIAYERARLAEEVAEARIRADAERFRGALLSSISHDFRTPLGSIMGAASTLLSEDASFTEAGRRELLATIYQAAERLNRYVRNLLDVTTIESDAVAPARDWVDIGDIIGAALQSLEAPLAPRNLKVEIASGLPLLNLDFVLIERVFLNLLENALKFSPTESAIEIAATRQNDLVVVTVFNAGSDVPPEVLPHLFNKFFRGPAAISVNGAGLGLSICRGFMAAHGGTIEALRVLERRGMVFRLTFPVDPAGPDRSAIDE